MKMNKWTVILAVGMVLALGSAAQAALVAHWEFEGTGQTVADSSGNGNDAVLGATSSPETSDPARVAGKFGNGLSFTAADNDRVYDATPSPDLGAYTGLSFTVWVKLDGTNVLTKNNGWDTVFTCMLPGGTNYEGYGMYGDRWAIGKVGSGWWIVNAGGSTITDSDWHLLAAIYDDAADTWTSYVDAVQHNQTTGVTSIDVVWANSYLQMGLDNRYNSNPFDAPIDDLRIYNETLSVSDLEDMMVIPEPATMSLLALGAIGIIVRRKRG